MEGRSSRVELGELLIAIFGPRENVVLGVELLHLLRSRSPHHVGFQGMVAALLLGHPGRRRDVRQQHSGSADVVERVRTVGR